MAEVRGIQGPGGQRRQSRVTPIPGRLNELFYTVLEIAVKIISMDSVIELIKNTYICVAVLLYESVFVSSLGNVDLSL